MIRWPAAMVLAAGLAAGAAAAAEEAGRTARPTLTFSAFAGSPLVKVSARVLTAAYGRLGIDLVILELPGARALDQAARGETDGEVMRAPVIEPDHPSLIRVPASTVSLDVVAFSAGLDVVPAGWDSLKPYRVGIVRGVIVTEKGTQGQAVTRASDIDTLFRQLASRRLDLAVVEGLGGRLALIRSGSDEIRELAPPLARSALYHYLHRRHAARVDEVAKAIEAVIADGIRDRAMAEQLAW